MILKENSVQPLPDAMPFGDTSRPSASLMFATIRNREHVIGHRELFAVKTCPGNLDIARLLDEARAWRVPAQ